jgi:hypothetical protein
MKPVFQVPGRGADMATVMSTRTCLQCGYEFGTYEINCRTSEWNFDCRRCGYGESLDWIADADGTRIGWQREILDGCGAVWATPNANGMSMFRGLRSAQEVEEAAQKMRDSIAKGELDGESSFVTRWDAEAKRAEVVVGKWIDLR